MRQGRTWHDDGMPRRRHKDLSIAPCPAPGIIIQGEADEVVTPIATQKLVDKLRTQRHITIEHKTVRARTTSSPSRWTS